MTVEAVSDGLWISCTMRNILKTSLLLAGLLMLLAASAHAQDTTASPINSGDTAWITVATALVLFMTLPGLSLFYAGLVRRRNVLSVLMHCFVITCVMSLLWLVCAYSLSFTAGNDFYGGLSRAFLSGVEFDVPYAEGQSIPELTFFAFQMTFFIITPALMVGAFVERMKFSAMLLFTTLWALLVYVPVCHMVWGGGSMFGLEGIKDHAGGIVVHVTAGIGALVAAIVVGPRKGFPQSQMPPHDLPLTVAGTGMLWVGWFGFNAGSGLAANGDASMTLIVTHTSAATGALVWMAIEWILHKRPSVLGIATGAVAGLAAITPASGDVGPAGAMVIGACSGLLCWFFSARIKQRFGYDDSLDVFGVHGIGGLVGSLLVAVFAASALGGQEGEGYSIGKQLGTQAAACAITAVYTAIVSYVLLKVIGAVVGLRVSEREENEGLDLADHGEVGYNN
ncbi:MAG: Amt family ammonium transporter [Verrucomicrobiales bacterium]